MRVLYAEEKIVCVDCEYKRLAFNETHTKKHTLVRVIQKVEESKVLTEERLKAIEDELSKMRQLFEKLFKKGMEGSPSDHITKGNILDAVMTEPSPVAPPSAKGEDGQDGEEEDEDSQRT